MIIAPKDAKILDGRAKINFEAPQGPRLAESKRSKSLIVFAVPNQSHLSSLMPSTTGKRSATLKTALKMATKELMPHSDGHVGCGRPCRTLNSTTIARSMNKASTRLPISGAHACSGTQPLKKRFHFFLSGFHSFLFSFHFMCFDFAVLCCGC
jgi:hypothetical protein